MLYLNDCNMSVSPSISVVHAAGDYHIHQYLFHNASCFSDPAVIKENNIMKSNIQSFGELKENWDSYGADSISPEAIWGATTFVENMSRYGRKVYFASPGPNGEVSIELKEGRKVVEVVFYASGTKKYIALDGDTVYQKGALTPEAKHNFIKWLNE